MNMAADRIPHLPNVTALWCRWSKVMNHRVKLGMRRRDAEISTTEDMIKKVPAAFAGVRFNDLVQAFCECEEGYDIPLWLLLYHDPKQHDNQD